MTVSSSKFLLSICFATRVSGVSSLRFIDQSFNVGNVQIHESQDTLREDISRVDWSCPRTREIFVSCYQQSLINLWNLMMKQENNIQILTSCIRQFYLLWGRVEETSKWWRYYLRQWWGTTNSGKLPVSWQKLDLLSWFRNRNELL